MVVWRSDTKDRFQIRTGGFGVALVEAESRFDALVAFAGRFGGEYLLSTGEHPTLIIDGCDYTAEPVP